MKKYDFAIIGSGLFGSTCAYLLSQKGYKVLVVDKRDHLGGNIYTRNIDGINVHMYGAHIFHTSNESVWKFINKFATFNDYVNRVKANYKGELYSLPFNMYTFKKMWNVSTPLEAKEKIEEQIKKENIKDPKNLEEQALSLVGRDVYTKLIKGYSEKQWGKKCVDLPSSIIKRLPIRYEYNDNYFNDTYQGIPIGGYTNIIKKMLNSCDIKLSLDYFKYKKEIDDQADNIIYTGAIDEYFSYQFSPLEYRSLHFDVEMLNKEYFQNNCVINYTDIEVPYTRIIEHKYFENTKCNSTVITKEFPRDYSLGEERYYSINDEKNNALYQKYFLETKKLKNVYFGGRLASYKYFDMDDTIEAAFDLVDKIIKEKSHER